MDIPDLEDLERERKRHLLERTGVFGVRLLATVGLAVSLFGGAFAVVFMRLGVLGSFVMLTVAVGLPFGTLLAATVWQNRRVRIAHRELRELLEVPGAPWMGAVRLTVMAAVLAGIGFLGVFSGVRANLGRALMFGGLAVAFPWLRSLSGQGLATVPSAVMSLWGMVGALIMVVGNDLLGTNVAFFAGLAFVLAVPGGPLTYALRRPITESALRDGIVGRIGRVLVEFLPASTRVEVERRGQGTDLLPILRDRLRYPLSPAQFLELLSELGACLEASDDPRAARLYEIAVGVIPGRAAFHAGLARSIRERELDRARIHALFALSCAEREIRGDPSVHEALVAELGGGG